MNESARSPKPKLGDTVTGEVTDLAYGGAGVLRSDGWVVMTRGAFPGDRIRARIRKRRKGLLEAELTEVIHPSPQRVAPRCPHLSICGGCALQGLDPAAQTRWKANQALELLKRIGGFAPEEVREPWRGPAPYDYRNKMEFTFGARPWIPRDELDAGVPFPPGPALGLHPRGIFQGVFNVEACCLQSETSNRIVRATRRIARELDLSAYHSRRDEGLLRHLVVRQAATTDDLLVVVVARAPDPRLAELARRLAGEVPAITGIVALINRRRAMVAQGEEEVLLHGAPTWRERVAGLTFTIGAASFFQTQTAGAEALIEEVLDAGGVEARDRVLDLYCGIGAFSLPLARCAALVLGVEAFAGAVAEARANAQRNGVPNAAFLAAPVEAGGAQGWERPPDAAVSGTGAEPAPHGAGTGKTTWDVIVIDPPRSGLHPKALAKVAALGAGRIVYVSCNPATLARDAGALVAEAGYRPRRLRVFDLFPQTPHLESVLLLQRP